MRWKYTIDNDRRTRIKYCWFPFSYNGTTYWLEYVKLTEVYSGYSGMWSIEIFEALGKKS